MNYVIFALVGFIAGVLSAGYVVSAIGGLRTELALLRVKATQDFSDVHDRVDTFVDDFTAELAKLKAKLP